MSIRHYLRSCTRLDKRCNIHITSTKRSVHVLIRNRGHCSMSVKNVHTAPLIRSHEIFEECCVFLSNLCVTLLLGIKNLRNITSKHSRALLFELMLCIHFFYFITNRDSKLKYYRCPCASHRVSGNATFFEAGSCSGNSS